MPKRKRVYKLGNKEVTKKQYQTHHALRKNQPYLNRTPAGSHGFRGAPRRAYKADLNYNDVPALGNASVTYTPNVAAVFTLLNGITEGAGYTDRLARHIRMKYLYIRGSWQTELPTATNQFVGGINRLIILYDLQANGAAPAATDVLNNSDPWAQINPNNRDRFKIMHDCTHAFPPYQNVNGNTLCTNGNDLAWEKYVNLQGLETIYNNTTNAIGSIASGALWALTIGSSATTTDSGAILVASYRLRFYPQ